MPVRWIQRDGVTPYLASTPILSREIEGIRPVSPVSPAGPPERRGRRRRTRPPPLREAYAPPSPRRPALKASQVMTTPAVTIAEDRPIHEAGLLMQERGFRHLPVVTPEGRLVGLLSQRDLLRGLPRKSEGPPAPPWDIHRVGDLMSRTVLTATPDTPLREIARVLVAERISSLPILDKQGSLVGILTATDLLRCLVTEAPLDLWI